MIWGETLRNYNNKGLLFPPNSRPMKIDIIIAFPLLFLGLASTLSTIIFSRVTHAVQTHSMIILISLIKAH